MANSEIHNRSSPCFKPINKMIVKESSFSINNPYPASVREISAMLVHARKESPEEKEVLNPRRNVNVDRDNNPVGRGLNLNINNSNHQCGSFFAKCKCRHEDKQTVANSCSQDLRSNSIPVSHDVHTTKRLSSPEIGT